jgi:hypothetical protein
LLCGMVGKKINCCVRSGWFSINVHFKVYADVLLSGQESLCNYVFRA